MFTLLSRAVLIALALGACAGAQKPTPCPVCPETASPTPTPVVDVAKPPAPKPPEPALRLAQVAFSDLPGWRDDRHGAALPALRRSCSRIAKLADKRPTARVAIGGTASEWRALCKRASTIDATDHDTARAFFESEFVPYSAANNDDPIGKFSGYYEATLRGSMRRYGNYQIPVYGRPKDLISARLDDFRSDGKGKRIWGRLVGKRMRPYYTRKEINDGALKGKRLEIMWVDDRVDRFFTQVQGSGRVDLDTGERVRINFDGKNGRKYTAIGRVLIADGVLTQKTVSMQSIRAWLTDNPDKVDDLLNKNDGFVFFRITKRDGPQGSEGVTLTDERSMAIDRAYIPQSIPIWVDTNAPVPGKDEERPWRQLVIAQDTGGAIRGPVRGDIYFGGGERGADLAGRMKGKGRYYLLLPKATAERVAP